MTERSLPFSVQQLCDFNHRTFIDTLQFNDSGENNYKTLIKVTNYYRQVIPVHIAVSKSIQARNVLLRERYKHFRENVKEMENETIDLAVKSEYLSSKVAEAKEKQQELLNKVQGVRDLLKNYKDGMTYAEIQSLQVLNGINGKINSFKDEIKNINSRLDLIKSRNEQIINNSFYFQDWQINLARNNLMLMNDSIEELVNEIKTVKETVDND